MPSALSALEASSKLGARLSALLDPDTPVNGVTAGKIEAPLLGFGVLSRIDGKPLKPTNLAVSSGWGHRTTTGIVMPGAGRIELGGAYNDDKVSDILGPPIDVMLNGVASWRAVPANVWSFRIGGYQVIKKWLSYREESVLGRSLTKDEAREVTYMVRRIAAILLMTTQLNANYAEASEHSFVWQQTTATP